MLTLTKGLEEEVYTGTGDGRVVGLSERVKAALTGFHTEPDNRNTEFATAPHRSYKSLTDEFIGFRLRLREYIRTLGDYTLIPGGTLSLGDTGSFHISDPGNPYYRWIRDAYGSRVVTASTHISVGVERPEDIIRVSNVLRCEASMYLALAAASPWLDGEATGYHSTRWHIFPKTPPEVPLFRDHAAYAAWVTARLASGEMQNHRHLWLGARPNGNDAPASLNRVELRICDRISYPGSLFGITALLEARILEITEDDGLDVRTRSRADEAGLLEIIAENEAAVSRRSLDATVRRWDDGTRVPVRDWIADLMSRARPYAERGGFCSYLGGVTRLLDKGSIAKRWLDREADGESIPSILAEAIQHAEVCDEACAGAKENAAFVDCGDA